MNFQQWQREGVSGLVRFYSLGRHALVAALQATGIGAGDAVLLPEFICRDVLASLHAVGAEPRWYPVGEDLTPASRQTDWPAARAVLAVNYFAFPQPLDPFRAYAERTRALLIEDNAHGFLSRDEDGRWLGTRAPVGIFSLRKTLSLADGAMLATADEQLAGNLPRQLQERGRGLAPGVALKAKLRSLPVIGTAAATAMTSLIRCLRRMQAGYSIPVSDAADEIEIPCAAPAHFGLAAELARLDVDREIKRRQDLYREAEAAAKAIGAKPLFPAMPALTAPYGFPFRANAGSVLDGMQRWAASRGLDLISWPALPSAIESRLPYHRTTRLVNFL